MRKIVAAVLALLSASLVVLTVVAVNRGENGAGARRVGAEHPTDQAAWGRSLEPGSVWHASWQFDPDSLAQARELSTAVVHARVREVRQAPPLVDIGEKTGRRNETPNQRIILDVVRSLHGNPGDTIRLWHMGTDTIHFEGDPPYEVGQEYVLFVYPKADEEGTYLVVSPEGRYLLGSDGGLRLMEGVEDGFAKELAGSSVAELAQALRQ